MIQLLDPTSAARVADWIELTVATTQEHVSKAEVGSILEGAAGSEPSEAFLTDIWRQLEYRQTLYQNPTFKVIDRLVEPVPGTRISPEYLACLVWSMVGVQGNTQQPGKLFERITRKAVEEYLSGQAIVFGWPFEPEIEGEDEESQIKRKIRRVAEELKERFVEAPPARFNDRGVDVIGWIPFYERRTGQLVLLVQCTAGDWKSKLPVPLDNWCQYIHWTRDPIKGFAVPSIIGDKDWHERSREKGIMFDRARIINLLPQDRFDPDLATEVENWVREQLNDLTA